MNYYSGVDYSGVPGEPIFINSNLILREPAVSWKKTEERQNRRRQCPLNPGVFRN